VTGLDDPSKYVDTVLRIIHYLISKYTSLN
jgi:hypothetical protein